MIRGAVAVVAVQFAAVAGVLTYAGDVVPAHGAPARESAPVRHLTPCPSDEGADGQTIRPCVWDARHMGNGAGSSFIVRKSGRIVHVSHARAHALINGRHSR